MTESIEAAFDKAMRNVYHTALIECGYRATRFLQLVESRGGVVAARQLLASRSYPEGLTKLWEHKRLDISMEALVLQPEWAELFADQELETARSRLKALNYL